MKTDRPNPYSKTDRRFHDDGLRAVAAGDFDAAQNCVNNIQCPAISAILEQHIESVRAVHIALASKKYMRASKLIPDLIGRRIKEHLRQTLEEAVMQKIQERIQSGVKVKKKWLRLLNEDNRRRIKHLLVENMTVNEAAASPSAATEPSPTAPLPIAAVVVHDQEQDIAHGSIDVDREIEEVLSRRMSFDSKKKLRDTEREFLQLLLDRVNDGDRSAMTFEDCKKNIGVKRARFAEIIKYTNALARHTQWRLIIDKNTVRIARVQE